MTQEHSHPILLFDGICNYCNRWVNFIIRHDKKKKFRFAALQSDAGKRLLKQYNIPEATDPPANNNKNNGCRAGSAVLIYNDKFYLKSSTGLHVLYHLGGIYSLAFVFIIIPAYIRDFYYDIIARNRYKWWGKRDACMIPSADVRERFLQ